MDDLTTSILSGIEQDLLELLQYDDKISNFMSIYGNLFTKGKLSGTRQMSISTVVSMPGSVIHAGPRCNVPRAIIFFTCGIIEGRKKRSTQTHIRMPKMKRRKN